MVWVLWKVFAFFILVYVLNASSSTLTGTGGRSHFSWLTASSSSSSSSSSSYSLLSPLEAAQEPLRVLYIVTSLAEYNTGKRKTVAGQDRLAEILLPVVADTVHSITTTMTDNQQQQQQQQYKVDVYLILAYKLRPEREQFIRDHLPQGVGLQIWDDAAPLSYDPPLNSKNVKKDHQYLLQDNTRTLARQHRYVLRDKLPYYDLFLAFEDDMRITASHVQHYIATSQALNILRQQAAQQNTPANHDLFYGPLTERQLDRIIPGFVRVEVLLDPATFGAQEQLDPVPLDYNIIVSGGSSGSDGTTAVTSLQERHFNATDCCHVPYLVEHFQQTQYPLPAHPANDNVVVWETAIKALSVREMPLTNNNNNDNVPIKQQQQDYLQWVALLPGPGKRLEPEDGIPGYWSGQDIAAFGQKPAPGYPLLVAQQGGWILTREQILRLDRLCQGSFLPPFDEPLYRSDGQESMNVEYWSGSYQLITGVKGGCNMQRIVSLHPDHVSKHFIYHAANNKQRQLSRDRMVKADHLWGQLNSVRKAAEKAKAAILAHDQKMK